MNIEYEARLQAEKFFEEFHTKKVGGSEMFTRLIARFERAMIRARKEGYEEGRERKSHVYAKGKKDGQEMMSKIL